MVVVPVVLCEEVHILYAAMPSGATFKPEEKEANN